MMKLKVMAVLVLLLGAGASSVVLAESPVQPVIQPVPELLTQPTPVPKPMIKPMPKPAKPAAPAVIAGQVVMPKSPAAAIPVGATVTVQLQDTSRADASAVSLGKQVITNARKFPIAFKIPYATTAIDPLGKTRFYTVSARIEKAGKLLFINDTSIYPFQFKPNAVVLPVIAVQ